MKVAGPRDHYARGAIVPPRRGPQVPGRQGIRRAASRQTLKAIVRNVRGLDERPADGLGVDRLSRRSEHAGHGRTGSGLRDARDSEAVALIKRNRSRVGRFEERGAVIGVDAHQTLLE